MNRLYRVFKPLLFLFDAELAHKLVVAFLVIWSRLFPQPRELTPRLNAENSNRLKLTVFGLPFAHPIGLGAGLDKGRVIAPACFRLGFSFVEIGSVTPRPQSGNPTPRMFRIVPRKALLNRMGFNNDGLAAVAARLARLVKQPGVVGINLGKNKDTPNEQAVDDYLAGFSALAKYADYIAINVSSPNTPGLRELQGTREITELISAVVRERNERAASPGGRRVPVLIKLSPDEPDERLGAVARAAVAAGADGIIATNTTLSREGVEEFPISKEPGGLSGAPLTQRALAACARIHRATEGKVPIIGVGGISNAAQAYARIRAGASLLQLYSALVFEGPMVAAEIARGLAALLEKDGLTMPQAIGIDSRNE
jgi:dihydroorotate dehydrogenase